MRLRLIPAAMMLALLAACGGGPAEKPPYAGIKIGKPYAISGHWYNPHYDAHYDEIGTASWYGPGFHGGRTATGERYDQEELTAAHRTLPLPSIVRVTNLDNGRSALIRVNDRGPYAHDRIIDLSHASAEKLGLIRSGTARVRVQFLDPETRQFVQNWQSHGLEYADNVLQGMSPQMASTEPQLRIETRTFGHTPEEEMAMNQNAVDPLPASVSVANEPAPPTVVEVQRSTPQYDNQPDIFSVVDNQPPPRAAPAVYQPVTYHAPAPQAFGQQEDHGFFVQAGTFGVEGNAQRLMERMENLGASQVMEIMAGGRKLYRVMMGPFNEQATAKNMLSKLAGLGISDAKIIRN